MTGGVVTGGVVTGGVVTGGVVTGGSVTGGVVTGGSVTGGFVVELQPWSRPDPPEEDEAAATPAVASNSPKASTAIAAEIRRGPISLLLSWGIRRRVVPAAE